MQELREYVWVYETHRFDSGRRWLRLYYYGHKIGQISFERSDDGFIASKSFSVGFDPEVLDLAEVYSRLAEAWEVLENDKRVIQSLWPNLQLFSIPETKHLGARFSQYIWFKSKAEARKAKAYFKSPEGRLHFCFVFCELYAERIETLALMEGVKDGSIKVN